MVGPVVRGVTIAAIIILLVKRWEGRVKLWQFWTLNGIAAIVLVLVAINITLFLGNRSLQVQLYGRQQTINGSIQISRFNTQLIQAIATLSAQLIQAIATLSAQTDDSALRDLLAAHGVTFTLNRGSDESSQ